MDDDIACLKKFADVQSDAAFRELVQGRINFVYGAALRQVGGDTHLAQEVAQNVFIDLARKARTLALRPNLTGWFYTSTRFAAAKALRSRVRRINHETEAQVMNEILSGDPGRDVAWDDLRPVLDAAMHELSEQDREAILLRYFDGRAFAEIGTMIGLAENSARMRVERALEKLRARLARRGIASTAAALGATLIAQPAVLAPAGLAVAISDASLAGFAAGAVGAAGGFFGLRDLAALGLVAVLGVGVYLGAGSRLDAGNTLELQQQDRQLGQLRTDNSRIQEENRAIAEKLAATAPAPVLPAVDPLARLRAMAALLKEGYIRVQWSYGPGMGDVFTPSICDLFVLNATETQALAGQLARAERDIGALALAQATVQRNEREIVINVPAIPAARESYERMCDGFRQTLGAERYGLMQDAGLVSAMERRLGDFGLTPAVLSVWHVIQPRLPDYPYAWERSDPAREIRPPPPGVPGPPRGPEKHPGMADLASMKQNLGPFGALVPENF